MLAGQEALFRCSKIIDQATSIYIFDLYWIMKRKVLEINVNIKNYLADIFWIYWGIFNGICQFIFSMWLKNECAVFSHQINYFQQHLMPHFKGQLSNFSVLLFTFKIFCLFVGSLTFTFQKNDIWWMKLFCS